MYHKKYTQCKSLLASTKRAVLRERGQAVVNGAAPRLRLPASIPDAGFLRPPTRPVCFLSLGTAGPSRARHPNTARRIHPYPRKRGPSGGPSAVRVRSLLALATPLLSAGPGLQQQLQPSFNERAKPMKEQHFDIHQHITGKIIAAIENGAGEFRLPCIAPPPSSAILQYGRMRCPGSSSRSASSRSHVNP